MWEQYERRCCRQAKVSGGTEPTRGPLRGRVATRRPRGGTCSWRASHRPALLASSGAINTRCAFVDSRVKAVVDSTMKALIAMCTLLVAELVALSTLISNTVHKDGVRCLSEPVRRQILPDPDLQRRWPPTRLSGSVTRARSPSRLRRGPTSTPRCASTAGRSCW